QALAGEKLRLKSGDVDVSAIQPGLLQRQQSRSAIMDGRAQTSPYHLVQFNKPLSLTDRKKIEDLGVEFLRYIPDDGYVVRATDRQLDTMVAANVGLRGHAPY